MPSEGKLCLLDTREMRRPSEASFGCGDGKKSNASIVVLGPPVSFPGLLGADGGPDDLRGAFRLIARLFWNGVSELAQPLGPLLLTYCILRCTDRPRHWDLDRDARLSRVSSMTIL